MRESDNSYYEEEAFKAALAAYENMVRSGSSAYFDADELTDIAEYYISKNLQKEAMACIQYARSLHPQSVDPQIFIARQFLFEGALDKAQQICDSIPDTEHLEVIFLKAEILIHRGYSDEAFSFLFKKYNSIHEHPALFLHDCIEICIDYNYNKQGLEWAVVLVANHPEYPPGRMLQADLLILNGKYEEAQELLQKELEADPYNQKAWLLMADSQCALGEYHDALDSIEYAQAISQESEQAMLTKAHCLFHLNQMEEAHRQYEHYLSVNPQDDNALYQDGICLANMERYEEAVQQLNKALVEDHTQSGLGTEICTQLAYTLSKLGQTDLALAALDKGEELRTPDDKFEKELLRGHVLLENGKQAEALKEFQLAIEKSKTPNLTWITMAISMCESTFYEDALDILEKIEPFLNPEQHALAVPYIAYANHQLERWEKYLYYLPKAVAENRETADFLFSPFYPGHIPDQFVECAHLQIYGTLPTSG